VNVFVKEAYDFDSTKDPEYIPEEENSNGDEDETSSINVK
jgi:hypothetical protein